MRDAQQRDGDAQDAAAARPRGRGRAALLALLFVQSLVTCACLLLTVHVYRRQVQVQPEGHGSLDKGVYLEWTGNTDAGNDSVLLDFKEYLSYGVKLLDERRLKANCSGPYVLSLWMVFLHPKDNVTLRVRQERGTVLATIPISALDAGDVSEMLGIRTQQIFSLSHQDSVVVHCSPARSCNSTKSLHLALHYLLGSQCFKE
ncbi:uncharacterized protein LOC114769683 [Denticeps clupeoides]|uniref:uncharacterized protein LOC114769683 n=1 Tax=Denticeps clupeoides TaxID=299321 RepID=UPI0010A3D30F|nr:uncharacterized protein LOC114769683 [Denticeps clupeoides]